MCCLIKQDADVQYYSWWHKNSTLHLVPHRIETTIHTFLAINNKRVELELKILCHEKMLNKEDMKT